MRFYLADIYPDPGHKGSDAVTIPSPAKKQALAVNRLAVENQRELNLLTLIIVLVAAMVMLRFV